MLEYRSLMRHLLRRHAWRPVTFLVLPQDSPRTYRVRLPLAVAALAGAGWLAALGVAGALAVRRADYEAMRLEAARLRAQHREFAREMAEAEGIARRLAPLERELERQLVRTRRAAERGGGEGGPRGGAEASLRPDEIPLRVGRLKKIGAELLRDYQGLSLVAAATPGIWPLRGWITSEFGERISPSTGEVGTLHPGVDIANAAGSPIVATADGVVVFAGWTSGGYGKMVEIAHGYGYATVYGHCSRLKAEAGRRVHRGDVIGYVGATGNATGPHVHYEVRLYGSAINPVPFLK